MTATAARFKASRYTLSMTRIRITLPLLLLGLWLAAQTVAQTTVYKVVDSDGNVTYTDTPPAPGDSSVETLQLDVASPAQVPDSQALIDQLAATADRLKQDRLDREEARKQPQQTTVAPAPAYPAPDYDDSYYGPYPFYPGIHRPGHWHKDRDRDHRDRDRRLENPTNWHVPLRAPRLGIDPLRERRQDEQSR